MTVQTTPLTTSLVRQADEGEITYFFNALMTTKASMSFCSSSIRR